MPYAENSSVRIYWEEHGQGDSLLLIMGLGYTLEMWHRTTPVLSQHYRTIVFDNRGVGRSDVPPGAYSIPAMAADAAAVMDSAGVDRAHVFGVSMGGMIAQEFALQYPRRVRSLILGCTSHGGPEAVLADSEVLTTLAARAMSGEEGVRAMVSFVYDPGTPSERIEEDLAIRGRTFPTIQGLFWSASSHLRVRITQPALSTQSAHAGRAWRVRPACST